jgi:hypothetical protein
LTASRFCVRSFPESWSFTEEESMAAGGQLFGYGSLPKASPEQLPLLLPGVRNCVVGLMNTQPGEKFLIIAENTVDPVVVRAFEVVAASVGADVSTMRIKPFSPAGIDPDNPSDVVVQAYAAADDVVIMSWFPDIHSKKLPGASAKTYNNKPVSMYQLATFEVLSSPAARFPLPLMFEMMKKMSMITADSQIRITNELGTDLVVKAPQLDRIFGGTGSGVDRGPMRRGIRAHFPPSTTGFVPIEADGVFVPNETVITGKPVHPIKVTVEGGYVTNIEGEEEAEALKAFINGPGRDPSPKRLVECMWGLNPKARINGANATFVEKERHAGALHLGIATYQLDVDPSVFTTRGPSGRTTGWLSHVDCYLETPSMWFNGERMVDKRRLLLLEDPEIRRLAREFGDPDELLRPHQPMDNITC